MSDAVDSQKYSVVVNGSLVDGFDVGQVKANLAKAFKLNEPQLEKLFSGKAVSIRRGVNKEQALKLKTGLSRAGMVASVKLQAETKTAEPTAVKPQAPTKPDNTQQTITCSRCGYQQAFATTCSSCKMDLRLYILRLERKQKIRDFRQQQNGDN